MRFARRVILSSLTVAVVATSPAAAAGNDTARPVTGTRTATTTLDLTTGAATTTSSGHLAHVGRYTGEATEQFFPSGTTFGFAGMATLVAANGDELFGASPGRERARPHDLCEHEHVHDPRRHRQVRRGRRNADGDDQQHLGLAQPDDPSRPRHSTVHGTITY